MENEHIFLPQDIENNEPLARHIRDLAAEVNTACEKYGYNVVSRGRGIGLKRK